MSLPLACSIIAVPISDLSKGNIYPQLVGITQDTVSPPIPRPFSWSRSTRGTLVQTVLLFFILRSRPNYFNLCILMKKVTLRPSYAAYKCLFFLRLHIPFSHIGPSILLSSFVCNLFSSSIADQLRVSRFRRRKPRLV